MVKKSALFTLGLYTLGPLPLIAVNYAFSPTYYGGYGLIPLATGAAAYTWLLLHLILSPKQKSPEAVSPPRHFFLFQSFIAAAAVILIFAHKLFLENVFQADARTLLGSIALLIVTAATAVALVFMISGLKALQRIRSRIMNIKIGRCGVKAALYYAAYLTVILAFIHLMLSHSAREPLTASLYILYFAAGSFGFFYNKHRRGLTKKKHAAGNADKEAVTPEPRPAATLIYPIVAVAVVLCCAVIFAKTLLIINKLNSQLADVPQPSTTASAEVIKSDVTLDHALVIITFDDGNESDYAVAYPILKKYGIKGTSFINPYFPDNHIRNKLSWHEIKQMAADGWEFGDHTYTHIALGSSTEAQIDRSMALVNNAFLRNGLNTPNSIAYPYGNLSQGVIDVIKQYRRQGRLAAVEDDIVDLNNIDPYQIQCVSADMQTITSLKSKELLVDKACEQKTVIVLRAHCVFRDKLNDMGNQPVQASSVLFEQLVKYCVNKGCEFTTMDGFLNLYASNEMRW